MVPVDISFGVTEFLIIFSLQIFGNLINTTEERILYYDMRFLIDLPAYLTFITVI
jgi:hypothetical protein